GLQSRHTVMFDRALVGVCAALAVGACGRVGFGDGAHVDARDVDAALASCPGMTTVHDEDGDLVGDPCDVCPHVPDAEQADGDGDGVGDVCDPEPALARQRIAFFHAFAAPLPEWTGGGQLVDGQLVLDVPGHDALTILDVP